jgi:hypothetical protein
MKVNNYQPLLAYPDKPSFLIEGETKAFHNEEKLKEFANTKPALQKVIKGLLQIEEETRLRQVDSRKSFLCFIDKTKQQGNKNDWKQQTLLNTNRECKWPQYPNQETE